MASELSIHGENVKKWQWFDLLGQGTGREGIFPCLVEINSHGAFSAQSLTAAENTPFGCDLMLAERREANQ